MKVLTLVLSFLLVSCNTKMKNDNKLSYDKSDFVEISNVIPDVVYDIRYYSSYNFTGKRVDGYKSNRAFLTKKAAMALKKASDTLRNQGYRIVVYDAYRPQKAVDMFVKWMDDINDEGIKSFYPNIKDKQELAKRDLVSRKSGHTRGSVVDISIVDMNGNTIDMGGTFDLFDARSSRNYKNITLQQQKNRKILEQAMVNAGFIPLYSEWWHFILKNEPYPNTYFDFDVE